MHDLVKRCQTGDPVAHHQLFTMFHKQVFRTAYHITRNIQEAEDVTQETFVDIHRDITKLHNPQKLHYWIRRIAVHHALKSVKRRRQHTPLAEVAATIQDESAPDPEEQFSRLEERSLVRQAMQQLNPSQRSILMLKHCHGLKEWEIARMLACNPGTVKSRLHYARKALRHNLATKRAPLGGS